MLLSLTSVLAQESGWPRTLPLEQGMVTIYSPQVDQLNGDVIHFRAALAYRATAGSEPVFGAGWFESRVEIDTGNRVVHPTDLKVIETRFPAGTDDVQSELSVVLAQQSPAWNLDFSLDELEAGLKTAQAESKAQEKLNTTPPRIVYRDHPALLVSIDGEPVLREIENSPYEAIINTPYPLIFDGRHYYLNAARDVWYRADKATGPYQFDAAPPADIAAMVNANDPAAEDDQPFEAVTSANAPEIVVSTEPTELVVTEGPAAFVPLVDDLLVLQNSDDDVFMHLSAQEFYIVRAGRWYRAGSLNGPWAYQPADKLPPAFANIPRDSDQADSRVYVAGTEEAREAVLDAQVPQTAAIARGEVDIDVEYDGDPVFEPVDGTDLVYADNTGSTVILSGGLYYLVEDGVWYVSTTPNGPWQVSAHRPGEVTSILPTSPVYNVKYVHVYDATPSVVYVGYTPGYTGSYVYHNTIFYGSGWYYSPWVSPHYYYPRHSTWGFNVAYNPWGGWSFGLSWGWGPFSVGYFSGGYWHRNHYWHHRHYGHWGPRGYRSRHHGYRRYARNDGGRGGNGRRSNDGHRSSPGQRNDNLYRDRGQRARVADSRDNLYRDGGQRARVADSRDSRPRTSGRQERVNDRRKSTDISRTDPIKSSVLRSKADLRDANARASRSRQFADNSGNVYRNADRGPDRRNNVSRSERKAKGTKSRTTPVPPDSNPNARRDSEKRTTQSKAVVSSRQLQDSSAARRSGQRSSPVASAPGQQTQHRVSSDSTSRSGSRTNSARIVGGRARSENRVNTVGNSTRQPQAVPAGVRKHDHSRPAPQPRISRDSGGNHSSRAQGAPQRSTQKAGNRRNGSDRGGGKRASGDRSKRH